MVGHQLKVGRSLKKWRLAILYLITLIDKNYGSQEKFPVTYSNTTPYANEIDGETLIEKGVFRKFLHPENTAGNVRSLNQKNYA